MGIWKQRIDESWLKCMGKNSGFKIINASGGTYPSKVGTALSLKHIKIDKTKNFNNPKYIDKTYPSTTANPNTIPRTDIQGFMIDGVGANTTLDEGTYYSYILDYYFGPSITDTKKFSFRKNYQFKTHTYNFAYVDYRLDIEPYLNSNTSQVGNSNLRVQIDFTNTGNILEIPGITIDLTSNYLITNTFALTSIRIQPATGYESVPYILERELNGVIWNTITQKQGDTYTDFRTDNDRNKHTFFITVSQEFKFTATLQIYGIWKGNRTATFAKQSIVGDTSISNMSGNGNLYYSYLNIFKNALGINPTWEDSYYFDVPYYKRLDIYDKTLPTMHILYYYSSPSTDAESGFVSFTNKLRSSKKEKSPSTNPATYTMDRISASQSVYAAGYGIAGFEINEIGWKIQGYSFASYDNDPGVGDYENQKIINYYSGQISSENKIPNKRPIKDCVFGKGWYYDDTTNEYTWYDRQFEGTSFDLNDKNNPVGGDAGRQISSEGYRSNNYIAKYIPFQKFNLSFLYECLRSDSGIKVYLSPTLPNSSPSNSSKYFGPIIFPEKYYDTSTATSLVEYNSFYSANSGQGLSLVNSEYQLVDGGLPIGDPTTGVSIGKYPPLSYANSPINIYTETIKKGFSFNDYNALVNGHPHIIKTMPTDIIQKGSIVSFDINSDYHMKGWNTRFQKSWTMTADRNFQEAWNIDINKNNNIFVSTSNSNRNYEIKCDNNILDIKGIYDGSGNYQERRGMVWAKVTIKQPTDASRSSIIMDYSDDDQNKALVNNIDVDDLSSDLVEMRVNLTLRHTSIGDLIINLRVPNGNVINLKAKGSGDYFNDLKNITFTTSTEYPKMLGLNFWPSVAGTGSIYDPIGLESSIPPNTKVPANILNAPWLPSPYNLAYNFDWSQLRILPGLTFQMDKINGQGSMATLNGFNNILTGTTSRDEDIDFMSNINDLKFILNEDGTFTGTYSLYIKDDTGGNSGFFEDWNIEFIYKKFDSPILSLTQSDPSNETNPGNPKPQYLFGLEGNQYLIIMGDKVPSLTDGNSNLTTSTGTEPLTYLKASLSNLKIDGGYHKGNNKMYQIDDEAFGTSSVPSFGGNNTFVLADPIENISYTAYVGYGDLNDKNQLSIGSVNAKIGNGKFLSGIWENGAWNSGWRKDESLQEFYDISDFFSYNRDKRWRFSVEGSTMAVSKFEVGDKVSIGNITAIDVNEERKLIKSYFTIMSKGDNSIEVEFESDFPIRRIKIDSDIHRIYITKNVWLTGGFFNGYFTGIWNHGLFKGFPYITEMFDSQWIDGKFEGGHFKSRKKSLSFSNTYMAKADRLKVGLTFDVVHNLKAGDSIAISSTFSTFGSTTILSVTDDYNIVTDINWDISKDPNTYGTVIKGSISTDISTGLVQNIDFSANNISTVTSLQSMDSTRVFIYDSWMDVNFDDASAVNIGRPQSTIDNAVSAFAYSDNNLYGYPTYDVLSSNVTFRDSFSNTVRNYRLGSKYKIYEDYIGNAGNFDEYFDITGWATKAGTYKTNTSPFSQTLTVGEKLPTSTEFANQGWVINKDTATYSAVSFERTTEALSDEDPAAGKEMRVKAVGKGGVLNIQPSYDITNRTNSPIEKQRYTIISFDMIQSILPDFIFEDGNKDLYDYSTKYQPLIHFNNLNYALRKSYVSLEGYRNKKLDSTYLPVYKNVNHATTENKSKIEYFYNKTNLSMFFRGNGLNGKNVSTFVLDNLKLYEVDMIPFFQYFIDDNINRSISVPYQAIAPNVEYVESNYSLLDKSIYGIDSFYIYQQAATASIVPESVSDAVGKEEDIVPQPSNSSIIWNFLVKLPSITGSGNILKLNINLTDNQGLLKKQFSLDAGNGETIVDILSTKIDFNTFVKLNSSSKAFYPKTKRKITVERRSRTKYPYSWETVITGECDVLNLTGTELSTTYDSAYQYRVSAEITPV